MSPRAAALDGDTQFYSGSYTPRRTIETFVEVTCRYAVTPWLQVQPDVQCVFNPGGGIANNSGTARVADELVLGVRTNILFWGAETKEGPRCGFVPLWAEVDRW